MEFPKAIVLTPVFGLFPPTAVGNDILAAVTIDIGCTKSVGKLVGWPTTGKDAVGEALGDVVDLPLPVDRLGVGHADPGNMLLHTHEENFPAIPKEVGVESGLVSGALEGNALLPVPLGTLGILVPLGWLAVEGDDHHIDPAVAVVVVRINSKSLGVASAVGFAWLADFMRLPVRSLIPKVPDKDVITAILVDISKSNTFGAKQGINNRLSKLWRRLKG